MADFIVAGIVLILIVVATTYIIKAKKKGTKCIGCPMGGSCGAADKSNSGGGCNCH